MVLRKCLLTKNDCYKSGKKISPKGIVVHSTGVNNPYLGRYLSPDDGFMGTPSSAHWNTPRPGGRQVCVHAFIGKCKDGGIATYQTLPFDMRPWACGSGKRGSYNNSHIQFEICEDGLDNAEYFNKVYLEAVEFCVYLCRMYNIDVEKIVCHSEAHKLGYASNHADVMHWFPKFGKSMTTFRQDVSNLLKGNVKQDTIPKATDTFTIRKDTPESLNIRSGPGSQYNIVGKITTNAIYTIVEVKGDWGKLKSGAGWINLNYTVKTA